MKRLLSALLLAATASVAACGGDSSAETPAKKTCGPLELPAATGAKASRADVDAIFVVSCSFATCHGKPPGSGKLYLPVAADGDWYAELVGKPSTTHASMLRVSPGDPAESFLVHKIEGYPLCKMTASCDKGDCGEQMPQGGDELPAAERATIIDWIRAGAPAQ